MLIILVTKKFVEVGILYFLMYWFAGPRVLIKNKKIEKNILDIFL